MARHIDDKPAQTLEDVVKASEREQQKETTQSPLALAEIDYMDDIACRKLCREELVIAIKANSGKPVIANLVNALLDRIDGKAPQASDITINATVKDDRKQFGLTEEQQVAMMREYLTMYDRRKLVTIENQ